MYFYIDSWELVRYVPQGLYWHPATDHLKGNQEYGTFGDLSQAFSKDWSSQNFKKVRVLMHTYVKHLCFPCFSFCLYLETIDIGVL